MGPPGSVLVPVPVPGPPAHTVYIRSIFSPFFLVKDVEPVGSIYLRRVSRTMVFTSITTREIAFTLSPFDYQRALAEPRATAENYMMAAALVSTSLAFVSPAMVPASRWCQPRGGASLASVRMADDGAPLTVSRFVKDLEFLGPCRFVVSGPGAILEAVGCFESYREMKPGLATVSTDDNSFECHLRLDQIKGAQFATKEKEDSMLHIVRLLDGERKPLLSAILAPEEGSGQVDDGAIKFWDSLRQKFGDDIDLVPDSE